MAWGRATGTGRLTFALCALTTACGNGDAADATLPAIATTVVTTTSTTPPTTTLVMVDPDLVDDCVDYVQFGAYTANPMLTAMWDASGRSVSILREDCVALGRSDPGGLRALSDGWHQMQASLASTTSTVPPTVAPRATPPAGSSP